MRSGQPSSYGVGSYFERPLARGLITTVFTFPVITKSHLTASPRAAGPERRAPDFSHYLSAHLLYGLTWGTGARRSQEDPVHKQEVNGLLAQLRRGRDTVKEPGRWPRPRELRSVPAARPAPPHAFLPPPHPL